MKTVTTTITGLFILFFTGRLVAQPVNTATNKIKPGYWYTTQDAQPTGVAVGTTGAAQVWDYSNLVAIPLSVGFDSMSLIGSFTVPSVFTGANTMFHSRNTSSGPTDTSYNFTIQVGDTLRNMGYYTPDNTFMQRLINPISLYPYYPFTYNDSLIDSTRTVYIGAFSSDTTWQYTEHIPMCYR
jgi:hypothetical protein